VRTEVKMLQYNGLDASRSVSETLKTD